MESRDLLLAGPPLGTARGSGSRDEVPGSRGVSEAGAAEEVTRVAKEPHWCWRIFWPLLCL